MRRRDFITVLAGATAWVATARGQEPLRVIGYLGASDAWPGETAAVYQGLRETGFVEGKNVSIEFRNADCHSSTFPARSNLDRASPLVFASHPPKCSRNGNTHFKKTSPSVKHFTLYLMRRVENLGGAPYPSRYRQRKFQKLSSDGRARLAAGRAMVDILV
jgi:hypothetical protein